MDKIVNLLNNYNTEIKLVMTERNHPIELTIKDEKVKNKIDDEIHKKV